MVNKVMEAFTKMLESTMKPMPNHCIECDKPTQETLCPECMDKEEDDLVSNCCTAQFTYPGWPDSDVCSKCKEHADIWKEEDG